MDSKFPCKCGHSVIWHKEDTWGIGVCEECNEDCDYEPSNLKYLEQRYEESLKNVN